MMQKLFWCGAATMAAALASVYLAADYVERNPNSVLAQGTDVAYRLGTKYNPAYRIGVVVVEQVRRTRHFGVFSPAGVSFVSACAKDSAAARMAAFLHGQDQIGPLDFNHSFLSQPPAAAAGPAALCPERVHGGIEDCDAEAAHDSASPQAASVAGAIGEVDECGDAKIMPPVGEEKMALAPAAMPYVVDGVTEEKFNQFMYHAIFAPTFNYAIAKMIMFGSMIGQTVSDSGKAGPHPSSCPAADKSGVEPEQEDKGAIDVFQPCRPPCIPKPGNTGEWPSHPDVDTTDFRPGEDSREGDFDPKPL